MKRKALLSISLAAAALLAPETAHAREPRAAGGFAAHSIVEPRGFGVKGVGATLGLPRVFGEDLFGAKLRLFGIPVAEEDKALPQLSIDIRHKRSRRLGAADRLGLLGVGDDGRSGDALRIRGRRGLYLSLQAGF